MQLYKYKPHLGMVPVAARERDCSNDDLLGTPCMSAPYPISWLDMAPQQDDVSEMEEEREAIDAELA